MTVERKPRILVCCLGNICRSPLGEAVLKTKALAKGIQIEVDSAGTLNYHAGSLPDPRGRAAGEARGYDLSNSFSRRIKPEDFAYFDMILAADKANLADILDECPKEYQHKVSLFLSHAKGDMKEIPDPYYGSPADFEFALDLIEQASDSILIQFQHQS